MNVAEVPYSKRKNAPGIRVWNGLNRTQAAADGEVIDCLGIGTQMWPALNVRAGRTRIGEWENATDVYETDGHMVVIDDNKLYYDGTFLSNVGGTKKQFAEINRKLVIWPDKIYINLNTGELGSLEANVKGAATTTDGGTIYLSGSTTSGSKKYIGVGHTEYVVNEEFGYIVPHEHIDTYFITYSAVAHDGVKWQVQGRESGRISVGRYFIGSVPPTGQETELQGTVYGKVTKIENITRDFYPEITYYDQIVHYELYDADAGGFGLESLFSVGDAVSVEGHDLFYNNREAARVIAIGGNNITVDAAFLMGARLSTLKKDYAPGTYKFVTRYANYEGEPNYGSVFTTYRTLRKGEQLFMVYESSGSYGNTQGGPGKTGLDYNHVYCYDPVTKMLDAFAIVSSNATDMEEVDAVNNIYFATSTRNLTISRKVPNMDFICERDNRLYGVSNSETETIFNAQTGKYETVTGRVLHASALGEPSSWNISDGVATDSWAVPVAGEGDFTGIVSYSGNVIAFKESKMYKLSGDYPAEFYLRSYTVDGVKEGCHKSLAIINEVLYFLSPYGVMSYSGGVPALISYNLDLLKFRDAVAGRDRTRYYISMEDPENGYMIYSYDTVRGVWVIESKEQATGIERVGDYAYACIGGKIYKLADEGSQETVRWEATLPETDEGAFEKKRYQYMRLIADVDGSLTVKCRQNDHEEWQMLGSITEKGKKIHALAMDTIRCDRIQFKLEGEGKATIWAMERRFTVGSER